MEKLYKNLTIILLFSLFSGQVFATSYNGSYVTQVTGPVVAGSSNQAILRIQIDGQGGGAALNINKLQFVMQNFNDVYVTNARLFYTGTTSTYTAPTQLGATIANPTGTISFTFTQAIGNNSYYFWLAYDISATAPSCTSTFDAYVPANGLTYNTTSVHQLHQILQEKEK